MSGGHDYTGNLEQVGRRLGRIETKVDDQGERLASIETHLGDINGSVKRHDLQLSQMSPQVQENFTRIDQIDRRDEEDRADARELREELARVKVRAKGESVEQDQIAKVQDLFREHWFKLAFGVTQAGIIYLLTRALSG